MFKTILAILLLVPLITNSKKLKIFQCIQSNGAIAYQEEVCNSPKSIERRSKDRLTAKKKVLKPNKEIKTSASQSYQATKVMKNHNNKISKATNQVRQYLFSIDILNHWRVINTVFNQKLLHMKFVDSSRSAKMSVLIDFIFPDNKKFSIKELTEILYLSASRYVEGSEQSVINPYQLKIINGKGVVTTFTGSDAVKDYRHLTKGLIYKGDWLVQFTIKSNSLTNNNYSFVMNALTNTIKISH